MPLHTRKSSWTLLLIAVACLLFVLTPGCTLQVAGQQVPNYVLDANSDNFDVADDVAALHYYGVGGWGVKWRGEYLLMAPYFSNHGFLEFYGKHGPDLDAIIEGTKNTPFSQTGLILVGHGHVDHAADIPAYRAAGLEVGRAGVIANTTTLNMLAELMPPNEPFRCAEAPATDGEPLADCSLAGFRVTPLKSAHAPNVKILGMPFTVSTGTVDQAQDRIPERPSQYIAGATWAFLIDLLDDDGGIVFRIHYMDAVAESTDSGIAPELLAERSIDVHIACVPGFEYVADYPEWAIEQGDAGYVLMGHWEDFFRPRESQLKPVAFVVNEKSLNEFANRIDNAISDRDKRVRPINKTAHDCRMDQQACGPRGEAWALPVPGETYHFRPQVIEQEIPGEI